VCRAATDWVKKTCTLRVGGTVLCTTRGVGLALSLVSTLCSARNCRNKIMQINVGVILFATLSILQKRNYRVFIRIPKYFDTFNLSIERREARKSFPSMPKANPRGYGTTPAGSTDFAAPSRYGGNAAIVRDRILRDRSNVVRGRGYLRRMDRHYPLQRIRLISQRNDPQLGWKTGAVRDGANSGYRARGLLRGTDPVVRQ